ncbi:MAG: ABC transporter ATP-binding protein [Clostridiales bacterium]|nr:ABC transporter ATP-binding protein [Clostridiales bacterium]
MITFENVTKSYNGRAVIDCVSHTFDECGSIAFYGHNGCGKSTMLKLIAGLISISNGKISYERKLRFSYVPEKFSGNGLKMIDYLENIARIEGVDNKVVNGLIKDFFLESMTNTRMDKLSKGSLQKVGVIQALMAPHDVIILDEPLSGQDADSQKVFISKMNDLRDKGVTIFMSCHEKRLIDALSDKVYTISQGKLIEAVSLSDKEYMVYVRRNDALSPWPEMTADKNRYELNVKEPLLRGTVLSLYEDGWEIVGIEQHN